MSEPCRSMAIQGAELIVVVPKGMALVGMMFAGGEAERPWFSRQSERGETEPQGQ